MTYRKIDVDGETYEYTIGETHVKIKGYEAIPKENMGDKINVSPSGWGEPEVVEKLEVRPKHIRNYILNNSLRISN